MFKSIKTFFARPVRLPIDSEYFFSLYAGSETGLATTAAILAGLSVASFDRRVIVFTAAIAVLVQAFNGAASRAAIEHTVDEIERSEDAQSYHHVLRDAALQFIAHISFSLVVFIAFLAPNTIERGFMFAVAITLLLLFVIGLSKGIIVKHWPLRDALESAVIGGAIISIGFLAGLIVELLNLV